MIVIFVTAIIIFLLIFIIEFDYFYWFKEKLSFKIFVIILISIFSLLLSFLIWTISIDYLDKTKVLVSKTEIEIYENNNQLYQPVNENGNTFFYIYLESSIHIDFIKIKEDKFKSEFYNGHEPVLEIYKYEESVDWKYLKEFSKTIKIEYLIKIPKNGK